jgi:two-component system sensor histidine kinase TctE
MASARGASRKGLFANILEWMLLPLAGLWLAAVAFTYFASSVIAEATFDIELHDITRAVGEEARNDARSTRPLQVLSALRNDPVERMYAQIAAADGAVLAGDAAMPRPDGDDRAPVGEIRMRDTTVDKQPVRMGYVWVPDPAGGALLVQVGDPLKRRHILMGNVTALVMGVVTFIVPVIGGLVWFGVWRGLRAIRGLRTHIDGRPADDLSALPSEDAPSELATLVESLNEQLDRVRRHLEAQRRFVADAAHQLRTPLAGLKAQADAALRGGTLEEARARLERIQESADRLGRLVAQLLSLARADDALGRTPPRESVELNALLREVCGTAAEQAMARQISLGFDAAPRAVEVQGSGLLLRELFANLVDNAIRYTPAGGEVSVRVVPSLEPAVHVEDSGEGVPAAERERIFERFHRVLGTGASGSGLGLAIVRTIGELHRAVVRVENRKEGGSRFIVAFPAPAGVA